MYIDGKLIGRYLKEIRLKKNLSIRQVSERLGIPIESLTNYEDDASNMYLSTLEEILKYYEIDISIFFNTLCDYTH